MDNEFVYTGDAVDDDLGIFYDILAWWVDCNLQDNIVDIVVDEGWVG